MQVPASIGGGEYRMSCLLRFLRTPFVVVRGPRRLRTPPFGWRLGRGSERPRWEIVSAREREVFAGYLVSSPPRDLSEVRRNSVHAPSSSLPRPADRLRAPPPCGRTSGNSLSESDLFPPRPPPLPLAPGKTQSKPVHRGRCPRRASVWPFPFPPGVNSGVVTPSAPPPVFPHPT